MEGKLATSSSAPRPRTAQPAPACCCHCHNHKRQQQQQAAAITRPFTLILSSIADIHFPNLQKKLQLSSSTMGKTAGHLQTTPLSADALTDISPGGVRAEASLVHPDRIDSADPRHF